MAGVIQGLCSTGVQVVDRNQRFAKYVKSGLLHVPFAGGNFLLGTYDEFAKEPASARNATTSCHPWLSYALADEPLMAGAQMLHRVAPGLH